MTISSDIQSLSPGHIVTLYELDMRAIGGNLERYHPHNDGPLIWQGNTYLPWAIEAADFERSGEGSQPSPVLRVGNIGLDGDGQPIEGVISALCLLFDDLVGVPVVRRRTFAHYLDGQPTADPTQEFPPERWLIEQKTTETPDTVAFALASPLQFDGLRLPSRQVIANTCAWLTKGGYRGPYCGYTGAAMFDANGNPVTDPALDRCGGLLSDCKLRFGENEPLSHGGFPAAGRTR